MPFWSFQEITKRKRKAFIFKKMLTKEDAMLSNVYVRTTLPWKPLFTHPKLLIVRMRMDDYKMYLLYVFSKKRIDENARKMSLSRGLRGSYGLTLSRAPWGDARGCREGRRSRWCLRMPRKAKFEPVLYVLWTVRTDTFVNAARWCSWMSWKRTFKPMLTKWCFLMKRNVFSC